MNLERGVGHLNWIEVGAVGWQETQPVARRPRMFRAPADLCDDNVASNCICQTVREVQLLAPPRSELRFIGNFAVKRENYLTLLKTVNPVSRDAALAVVGETADKNSSGNKATNTNAKKASFPDPSKKHWIKKVIQNMA